MRGGMSHACFNISHTRVAMYGEFSCAQTQVLWGSKKQGNEALAVLGSKVHQDQEMGLSNQAGWNWSLSFFTSHLRRWPRKPSVSEAWGLRTGGEVIWEWAPENKTISIASVCQKESFSSLLTFLLFENFPKSWNLDGWVRCGPITIVVRALAMAPHSSSWTHIRTPSTSKWNVPAIFSTH